MYQSKQLIMDICIYLNANDNIRTPSSFVSLGELIMDK